MTLSLIVTYALGLLEKMNGALMTEDLNKNNSDLTSKDAGADTVDLNESASLPEEVKPLIDEKIESDISTEVDESFLSDEAMLKVDLDGDGRKEKITSYSEKITKKQFEGSLMAPLKNALATVQGWDDLSDDPVNFNVTMKNHLTSNLGDGALALFSAALFQSLPSKTSPQPVHQIKRNAYEKTSHVRNSNIFFSMVYQSGNFMMNGSRYDWADSSYPAPVFRFEMMQDEKSSEVIPHLQLEAAKVQDYNCSNLVSKEEAKQIFGDLTADQLSMEIARLCRLWGDAALSVLSEADNLAFMVGEENLPKHMAGSGAHYASAIEAGMTTSYRFADYSRAAASPIGRNFINYLERHVAVRMNFGSEEEAFTYLMSNPPELDDFLWSEEALDWLLNYRKTSGEADGIPDVKIVKAIKSAQRKVLAFTNLLDKKWKESYETNNLVALCERFGHPVGIPSASVRAYHFLPGGYLIESGWAKVQSSNGFSFTVNFPIDENGAPEHMTEKWENLNATINIDSKKSALGQLADLAEGAASAVEAWQVAYNRALPRDSLYNAALLSVIDPSLNGVSYDDFSGTVRGLYHPMLKGIELAVGRSMRFYPSTSSKLSALSRKLVNKEVCPRGVLSIKEIDLSNWRLSRLSDNQCGNEYGVQSIREGQQTPFNFDKLSREFHEGFQNKIRSYSVQDGLVTFCQADEDDFVRPLVGRQRGEAMRIYIERPGSYLRRTGAGGSKISEGAPKAVFEQIKFPMTPWSAYTDTAIGKTSDCTITAQQAPAQQSLNPYLFCAKGSGTIFVKDLDENQALMFNKFVTVSPGRRGENLPRRLRFAFLSLGEKSSTNSGLIASNVISDSIDTAKIVNFASIHEHTSGDALMSNDEPIFAKELLSAAWHHPVLYAKDFEMGEMGENYLKLSQSINERKALLQMFLAGRQSSRQLLLEPGLKLMSILQVGYYYPADNRLAFGDLSETGSSITRSVIDQLAKRDGTMPEFRKQGLTRGAPIVMRRNGSFPALIKIETWLETSRYRADEEYIPAMSFLFAARAGHRMTGLEDLPFSFPDERPIDAADYHKSWSSLVVKMGKNNEFEAEEYKGQDMITRNNFNRMVERLSSKIEDKRRANENIIYAFGAFSHCTQYVGGEGVWQVSIRQAESDEILMRAAHNSENLIRKEILVESSKYPDKAFEKSELYEKALTELRQRGRKKMFLLNKIS